MVLSLTYYRASGNILSNTLEHFRFRGEVLRLTQKHGIKGFTLLKALGAWEGKTEPSYQLLVEGVPKRVLKELAKDFRDRFRQDAVMLNDGKKVEYV